MNCLLLHVTLSRELFVIAAGRAIATLSRELFVIAAGRAIAFDDQSTDVQQDALNLASGLTRNGRDGRGREGGERVPDASRRG